MTFALSRNGRTRFLSYHLHASGQRIGQARQCHDIGRTGQKKTAGLAVPVNRQLDGRKQSGRLLDFIDYDRSIQIADKA